MRKMNIPQAICAFLGFLAVLLLPFYSFRFLGFNYYNIVALDAVSGLYPILMIPVAGMLVLTILALTEAGIVSMISGGVLLAVQILFVILKSSVVFSGDISFLANKLTGLIEQAAGLTTNIDIRMLLAPMLKPGIGFYVGLCLNLIYLVLGVLPLGLYSGGSGSSTNRRNFDGRTTGNHGRRSF